MHVLRFGENNACVNKDAIKPLARFELILIIILKFEQELSSKLIVRCEHMTTQLGSILKLERRCIQP